MSVVPHEAGQAARRSVDLAHGRVSYLESGEGESILFLHGLNGNGGSWMEQLNSLSGQYRVVAWDAPGYGESDLAGETVDALARVALEFMERTFTGPVHLVGHSMGGLVAMKVAMLAPERVRRLVLSCTHPGHGLSRDEGANDRYRRRLEELKSLSAMEYGRRRAKGMLPEGTGDRVIENVARIAAESRLEGVAAAAWAIQTADLRPELDQITAPTLVITCDRDRVAPLEKAKPMLALIPGVAHVALEGLGHAPYMEDVGRYNAALVGFLSESS